MAAKEIKNTLRNARECIKNKDYKEAFKHCKVLFTIIHYFVSNWFLQFVVKSCHKIYGKIFWWQARVDQYIYVLNVWDNKFWLCLSCSRIWIYYTLSSYLFLLQHSERSVIALSTFTSNWLFLQVVLKADKTNYNALVFFGKCASELGQLDQAHAAYRKAIESDDTQPLAWQVEYFFCPF